MTTRNASPLSTMLAKATMNLNAPDSSSRIGSCAANSMPPISTSNTDDCSRCSRTDARHYRERAIAVLEDSSRAESGCRFSPWARDFTCAALLEGLADVPLRSEELRERLWASVAAHPPGHLHRILKRMDPLSAEKIAPGDEQKLIRAVEVCLLAKKPLSEVHRAGRNPCSAGAR